MRLSKRYAENSREIDEMERSVRIRDRINKNSRDFESYFSLWLFARRLGESKTKIY